MNVSKLPIHHAVLGLYQNNRETRRFAKKVIKTVGFNSVLICGYEAEKPLKLTQNIILIFNLLTVLDHASLD
jgi:hypothetical protein